MKKNYYIYIYIVRVIIYHTWLLVFFLYIYKGIGLFYSERVLKKFGHPSYVFEKKLIS